MEWRAVRHVSIIISIRELVSAGRHYAPALNCCRRMYNTINKQMAPLNARSLPPALIKTEFRARRSRTCPKKSLQKIEFYITATHSSLSFSPRARIITLLFTPTETFCLLCSNEICILCYNLLGFLSINRHT